MHNKPLKVGLLTSLIGLACALSLDANAQELNQPGTPSAKKSSQSEPELRKISYSADGCYGSCPSYRVEIDSQGQVVFTGHAYTQVKGTQRKQISPQAFAQIQQLTTKIRLRKLDRNYGPNSAHCPIWRTDASGGGIEAQYAGEEPIHYSWYNGCTSMSADLKPLYQVGVAIMKAADVQDWVREPSQPAFP